MLTFQLVVQEIADNAVGEAAGNEVVTDEYELDDAGQVEYLYEEHEYGENEFEVVSDVENESEVLSDGETVVDQ